METTPEKQSKIFVLDTNILIHQPEAVLAFEENTVVIPIEVFEELDKLKTEHHSGRGKSSRVACKLIDRLIRESPDNDVREGVKLPNDGILQIPTYEELPKVPGLNPNKKDNQILATAMMFSEINTYCPVYFVSKDINARIKAEALGLIAQDYEHDKKKIEDDDQYKGYVEIPTTIEKCWELKDMKSIEADQEYYENQYCFLTNPEESTIYMGRYDKELECFKKVEPSIKGGIIGVNALNIEQRIAFDALLDPKIQLVTLVGSAGTGKTLLALAAGLQQTTQDDLYKKVSVSRPVVPMGNDIGFLPGDVEAKLTPYTKPIFDNLEYITEHAHKQNLNSIEQLLKNKTVEIEALTYIRGRSLPNQFIIVDEAQNLTSLEVKTIVSRAGEGTKIVFTGDPNQIDNPYLDAESNGLVTLVNAFKEQKLAAHITLTKTERSELAEKAVQLL